MMLTPPSLCGGVAKGQGKDIRRSLTGSHLWLQSPGSQFLNISIIIIPWSICVRITTLTFQTETAHGALSLTLVKAGPPVAAAVVWGWGVPSELPALFASLGVRRHPIGSRR